jgi:hypothetical protein
MPFIVKIFLIAVASAILAFIVMYFMGSFTGVEDLFNDDWGLEDIQWSNGGQGLRLTITNSLTDEWDRFFDESVSDWNAAPSLSLSTNTAKFGDDRCSHINDVMRVCNGEYGRDIGWQGVNEALFYEDTTLGKKIIVSSVAIINDSYLRRKSDAQKLYVMCHELGHGFGLPHRDERTWNRDLGSCLDYTRNYRVNMRPDTDVDFQNLTNLYGTLGGGGARKLRQKNKNSNEQPLDYTVQNIHEIAQTNRWDYREGRLLHQSTHRAIYENDLGNGVKVVTTFLKVGNDDDEDH